MFYIRGKAIAADGREMMVEGRDHDVCENKARRAFRVNEVMLEITHRTAEMRRGSERVFYTWEEYDKLMDEHEKKARERVAARKAEELAA